MNGGRRRFQGWPVVQRAMFSTPGRLNTRPRHPSREMKEDQGGPLVFLCSPKSVRLIGCIKRIGTVGKHTTQPFQRMYGQLLNKRVFLSASSQRQWSWLCSNHKGFVLSIQEGGCRGCFFHCPRLTSAEPQIKAIRMRSHLDLRHGQIYTIYIFSQINQIWKLLKIPEIPVLGDHIRTRRGGRKCHLPTIEQCREAHQTSSLFPLIIFPLEQVEGGCVKDLWLVFIKTIYWGVVRPKKLAHLTLCDLWEFPAPLGFSSHINSTP